VFGQAAASIEGTSLTKDNFKNAVEILQDKFAQTQVLISSYMDKLLHLSAVKNAKDTTQLRELYNQLEVNIRSLSTAGVQSETYGTLLIPIIMNKIPTDITLEINRKLDKKDTWNVDKILSFIKSELETRELCSKMKSSGMETPTNKIVSNRSSSTAS